MGYEEKGKLTQRRKGRKERPLVFLCALRAFA
jgi:hypothetical protein